MSEEKNKKSTEKVSDPKNKQKNLLVLFAIAVLIGAGAYYFINQKNINTSTPPDMSKVSEVPDNSNSNSSNSGSELTSKKWTWINTKMSDGAVTEPSKPSAFTATFQDDGRLVATTDCNNGNSSFETGPDNSLTIGPMATTMMFCEGSSQDAYFQQLGNIGSYKISNGQLWLMIKFDSGTMIFE